MMKVTVLEQWAFDPHYDRLTELTAEDVYHTFTEELDSWPIHLDDLAFRVGRDLMKWDAFKAWYEANH